MSFPLITVKDIQLPDNIRKVESLEDAAGVFDGFGGALADILPNVALSTGSNATTAYFGTFGTGQIEAAAAEARELGLIDQDPKAFAEEQRARAEDVAKEWRRLAREKYTPDPYTTGIAGQIVHGVGTEITKGLAASALALGNPAGAAALYGTQHGIETYDKYRDKGVDDETALNAGVAAFAAGTLGMALPAAWGPTRLRSAIYGAVVNPAANVSEELVTRTVLDNAGYTKIASEIDPFDPVNLLTAAVIGGGFGAIGFRAGERASRAADTPRAADNGSGAAEAALAAESATAPRQTAAGSVPENAASPAREGASRAETSEPRVGSVESVDVSEVRRASTMRQSESGVMLQNRNRGTFSSRAQMQSIAAAPDYDRVSVSRDFAQGAPVVAYVSDLPAGQVGRVERVTASDGSKMTMRYAVMEADSILTSNRADGSRVEEYGTTDWHVTIAGNGRVAGITEAYRRGTAAQYKADLVADAEAVGIAPQVIEGMEKPVLVRLMSDKDAARPDIAQLSNESGTKALDATEQAENDAASIDVAALAFDEEGNITPEGVAQFAAMIPDNSSILDQGGVPNSLARPRLERAIFQRVYGRPYLTSLLTDTEGGGRIVQVLMRLAPKMMQLEEAGDLDFRNALVAAATEIYEMRASGSKASLRELAAQRPLGRTPETQAFLTYFAENAGKVLEPVRVFSDLADWASANRYDPTSMFADETPQATRADLLAEFGDLAGVPVDPQLVALVQSDVTREQKIEKLRRGFTERLEAAGFPDDQVEAQVTLWVKMVDAMASQAGVDISEIAPTVRFDPTGAAVVDGAVEQSARPGADSFYQVAPGALATVHNISEDNLLRVRDLGGLAVPSLGITRADSAYTGFGDITLIGTKSMVDPETGVPVFSQDAYTNRFPDFAWEKSVDAGAVQAFSQKIAEWGAQYPRFNRESFSQFVRDPDPERFARAVSRDTVVQQAFLAEKGITVEPVYDAPEEVSALAQALRDDLQRIVGETGEGTDEFVRRMSEAYADAVERLGDRASEGERRNAAKIRDGGRLRKLNLYSLIREIEAERPSEPQVNRAATADAIERAVASYVDEYRAWVAEQTKGIFGEPKIKVGNSFLPVTLENVVRAMTMRTARNQESTVGFGPGKVRAAAARQFRTLSEIQESRDSIGTTEAVNAQNAAIDARMSDFRGMVERENAEGRDTFAQMRIGDTALEALADSVKRKAKPTPARVKAALQKAGLTVSDETAAFGADILTDVRNSLSDYFEAKPQRGVKLNEFAGAVVPRGTSEEAVKALEDAGLEVRFYDEGNRQAEIGAFARELQESRGDVLYQSDTAGAYTPSANAIRLTPKADITTFSHEMGHWWLETAIRLTKSSGTNLELRRDVRKLFDLWGVKSHADWDALGTEGQRRFHEQFAAWVEEYLSTGRPPAPQLQSLFEKFRAWITELYRDFRAHLNERYRSEFGEELPELSQEVRDILDRNLAYEDALTQARREFAPSQVSADAARYASYQRTVLADQPVDQGDAQQLQTSLFAEADALAALDRGEKVSVSAPVDADWANGEVQRIREELRLPASILPREPETDLPVYEAPQRMTAVEQAENLAGQNQTVEASPDEGPDLFDMDEDGGEAPSPAAQKRSAPAADLGAMADDAHLAKRAQELAERSPDMPVGITGIGQEIENLTVGDLLTRAENEAADIERMADVLSPAAECILRNGGI